MVWYLDGNAAVIAARSAIELWGKTLDSEDKHRRVRAVDARAVESIV
jgi:hypothetical protein